MSNRAVPERQAMEALRARARVRVNQMSLPTVARAVGMSPLSLERFLAGGGIQNQSRRKLFQWLVESGLEADERGARCVRMLREVLEDLPEERRMQAVEVVLGEVARQFEAIGGRVPLWLSRVEQKVAAFSAME